MRGFLAYSSLALAAVGCVCISMLSWWAILLGACLLCASVCLGCLFAGGRVS